jgi:hypothetical protein
MGVVRKVRHSQQITGVLGENMGNTETTENSGTAGDIARCFHEAYEELAPQFGYETREASAKPWEEVPKNNRDLMIATVAQLLEDGIITATGVLGEK